MRQRQTGQADKLGIYIHIPFCRSKCDYCDFYSLAGPAHPGAALRPEQAFSGGEGRRDHGGGKP